MMRSMKKLFRLSLAICMSLCLAACSGSAGSSTPQPESSSPSVAEPASDAQEEMKNEESSAVPQDETANVLVAYFSVTGNTESVAESIAEVTGGDLYEILPAEPYTEEDLDYGNEQSRTSLEMNDLDARPEIGSDPITLDGYSTIYLGYPIWHGQAPRIMSTFVENNDFDGITVIPFCTSGGSGIGSSADTLAEQAGSGSWLEGERFSAGVSEDELRSWIDTVQ